LGSGGAEAQPADTAATTIVAAIRVVANMALAPARRRVVAPTSCIDDIFATPKA
jgi:hypothetical protein